MSVRGAETGQPGTKTDERRGGVARVHFEALVDVGEPKGGGFEAESIDVSPEGMRLRTAYLPEVGDKLCCRFDGGGTELVLEAEVLWRTEEARGGEFGLRFVGVDEEAAAMLREMCAPAEEAADPSAPEAAAMRGTRVRLHIEGLGSPMKARVRDATSDEVQVGSNLEFLKVGRALELEDVEGGTKRGAYVDRVEVDVDPATNVPQLVLSLRFDEPAKRRETAASTKTESAAPSTHRAASGSMRPAREPELSSPARDLGGSRASVSDASEASAMAHDDDGDESDSARDLRGAGAKAAKAGLAMAGRIGPALAGLGARGKDAMGGLLTKLREKRAERAEEKKASGPRRMTAPPPTGALKADGRRLVRDDGSNDDDQSPPPPPVKSRRAAVLGGLVGLVMVLGIIGVTRATSGKTAAASPESSASPIAALAAAAPSPSGLVTATVPLFGVTPLSTTESVPAIPTPPASGSAVAPPGDAPKPVADSDKPEEEPSADSEGPAKKEWGTGGVSHPVVLKIKMDGPIERINGASGAMGFTVSVPGRRSVSSSSELSHKDKRLASVNVVNNANGAEITVQFKDGVPPYMAKVKGDRLEIALGKEKGDKKVASKSKKKHHDDDGGKKSKKKTSKK